MTDIIHVTGTVLVAAVAVLSWVFILRYRTRPWWVTREGIHLMSLTLMIAIFTSLATETRLFGPYPGSRIVAVVLYGVLLVLMVRQHLLLTAAGKLSDDDTEEH